jgi:hypothetical protein
MDAAISAMAGFQVTEGLYQVRYDPEQLICSFANFLTLMSIEKIK